MNMQITVEPRLTPLNSGHPSTADTHDVTDNSESPDCPSVQQPLNSGHPATPHNGQFSRSQLYANDPDLADTRRLF